MKSFSNIEPSAFHKGQYVGYGGGLVWRITKSTSSFGNWSARPNEVTHGASAARVPTLFAMRLEEMPAKLGAFVDTYTK